MGYSVRDILELANADVDKTLERFSNNEQLVERFIRKYPTDQTMENLRKAVEAEDHKEIEFLAHTAKGNAANLGFQKLSDMCSELVLAMRENRYEETDKLFDEVWNEYKVLVSAIVKLG